VVSSTCCFSHGRQQSDQKHEKKKVIVRANSVRQELLEFVHEDARFEGIHAQGELQQFQIGLPLALAKICPQNDLRTSKGGSDLLQASSVSEMSLRTCSGKLSLVEAEPDSWFLLIIRKQFELGRCYRSSKFMIDLLHHGVGEVADGCSPGDAGDGPGGDEEGSPGCREGLACHCENRVKPAT
jgi:hypothetical protein